MTISYEIIKLAFRKLIKIYYGTIMSVRFCLSYDLLNAILLPSKFDYFTENWH